MVTIALNENSEIGESLLAMLKEIAKGNKDVLILDEDTAAPVFYDEFYLTELREKAKKNWAGSTDALSILNELRGR